MIATALLVLQLPATYMSFNYHNDRFGFDVSVPAFLIKDEPPVNGDGQRFFTKDRKFQMSASGILNVLDRTLGEELSERLKNEKGKLLGTKSGKDWFAYSYRQGNQIRWQKMYLVNLKSGDGTIQCFQGLYFEYDVSISGQAQGFVTRVIDTFKKGKEYWQ